MTERTTIYLLDAHYLIFRAYYALPELLSPDGTPMSAVFGFAQSLIKIAADWQPRYLAAAFDEHPVYSFRSALYPGYKADRREPPEDLEPQFSRCVKVARALGIPSFIRRGFEADDILAALARRLRAPGRTVEIVTEDKDMYQLIRRGVVVRTFRGVRIGTGEVRARFGVSPAQAADYQALVGDPVDSIPGVPGVGPKTARMLLANFADLEEILGNLHRIADGRLRQRLEAHAEQARLSLRLTRLRDDVPLRVRLTDLRYRGAAPRTRGLFKRLGLHRLIDRVPLWAATPPRRVRASGRAAPTRRG